MWSGGTYKYPDMQIWLERLERSIPGSGGQRSTGFTSFVNEDYASVLVRQREEKSITLAVGTDDMVYMQESLFVLPDAFDDDLLAEACSHLGNPDILFVPGDLWPSTPVLT